MVQSKNNFDLLIIGSGISCSLSLLHFLNEYESSIHTIKKTINIAIIERDEVFWKGMPYGNRSSVNALIITPLADFIHQEQKDEFLKWLESNFIIWKNILLNKGGDTAQLWLQENETLLIAKKWDDIYIPRFLYGMFIDEIIQKKINNAISKGFLNLKNIRAEVITVSKINHKAFAVTYQLPQQEYTQLIAKDILLAIGSPALKTNIYLPINALYINDIYFNSEDENLQQIFLQLSKIADFQLRNILIIGSNASAIEILYLLGSNNAIMKSIHSITVLSTSGALPNKMDDTKQVEAYEFSFLGKLQKDTFTAKDLMQAILKEQEELFKKGLTLTQVHHLFIPLFYELLNNQLSEKEQYLFYTYYGMQFSKLIRRAGKDYYTVVNSLLTTNKLNFLKGTFNNVNRNTSTALTNKFQFLQNGVVKEYEIPMAVYINCMGFEPLNETTSPLLGSLIENNICEIHPNNIGFTVNEYFEASKNFYIMGPLLNGIFNKQNKLWHVENAKSIYHLAKQWARNWASKILPFNEGI
jgi:uncharacterized NAD(P)/FAD-binding protein YdhS